MRQTRLLIGLAGSSLTLLAIRGPASSALAQPFPNVPPASSPRTGDLHPPGGAPGSTLQRPSIFPAPTSPSNLGVNPLTRPTQLPTDRPANIPPAVFPGPQQMPTPRPVNPGDFSFRQRIMLRTTVQVANRLIEESKDAFERGLMPLHDYAEHLKIAVQLSVMLADIQGSNDARIAARDGHVTLLQSAVKQLQAFNQPGAAGWAADVAEAQLLLTNAELAAAQSRANPTAVSDAARRGDELAQALYRRRLDDFNIGLATVPQLVRAMAHASSPGGIPAELGSVGASATPQLKEFRDRLAEYTEHLERAGNLGAGIGRDDAVAQARFDLARADAIVARSEGNHRAAAEAVARAEAEAARQLESQLKYVDNATATLFEVTATWMQVQALHDNMALAAYPVPDASTSLQKANLRKITMLADRTTDLRGRNAADVTLVRSLNTIEQLKVEFYNFLHPADTASAKTSPGKQANPTRAKVYIFNNPKPSAGLSAANDPTQDRQ